MVHYTSFLLGGGQKLISFRQVTINFTCHIKFWSNMWNCTVDISKYYKPKFQIFKGSNFKDILG